MKELKYYLSHSNGDYNGISNSIEELTDDLEFELEEGGAEFLIITKRSLKSDIYGEIQDMLSNSESYES